MSVICEALILARSQHLFLRAALCGFRPMQRRSKRIKKEDEEAHCKQGMPIMPEPIIRCIISSGLSFHFGIAFARILRNSGMATKSCFACSREREKWKMFLCRLHRYENIKMCNSAAKYKRN